VTRDAQGGAPCAPAPLKLPRGMLVRSQHILVDQSQTYLGLASPEWDGRGHTEMVWGFCQDSRECKLMLELAAPCSKLALDRSGQLLFGLSSASRSFLAVDLQTRPPCSRSAAWAGCRCSSRCSVPLLAAEGGPQLQRARRGSESWPGTHGCA